MADRPNILLIHADQHRFDCLGVNGHQVVQTPHLDALAARGVNFTHAMTPCPVCSPARASLLTGTWPTAHGCMSIPGTEIYRPADPSLPTLWTLLSRAGYQLGLYGRFHGEVCGAPCDHGVSRYVSDGSYADWRRNQGLPVHPPRWDDLAWLYGEVDEGISAGQSRVAWLAGEVIAGIEDMARSDEPFFIRFDPVEPHLPNHPPCDAAALYAARDIPPWPSFGDSLAGKPPAQRRQRRIWGIADWTWSDFAPLVARYFADITLLDMQVGRILARLDELGLTDNTLVIYTADHGDMCGSHGLLDKHFNLYDDILRVPLIAAFPGRIDVGSTCDAFVIHELDIARTILDVAGIGPPDSFVGDNLLDLATGDAAGRADVFATYHGTETGLYSQRAVRDQKWKYIWNATEIDELYDLQSDPSEQINLITDHCYADQMRRLRGRMWQWMRQCNDPLANVWLARQWEVGC